MLTLVPSEIQDQLLALSSLCFLCYFQIITPSFLYEKAKTKPCTFEAGTPNHCLVFITGLGHIHWLISTIGHPRKFVGSFGVRVKTPWKLWPLSCVLATRFHFISNPCSVSVLWVEPLLHNKFKHQLSDYSPQSSQLAASAYHPQILKSNSSSNFSSPNFFPSSNSMTPSSLKYLCRLVLLWIHSPFRTRNTAFQSLLSLPSSTLQNHVLWVELCLPKRYVEVLMSGTWECNVIWK